MDQRPPGNPGQTGARWIEMPIAFTQASTTSTSVLAGPDAPALSSFAYGIHAAHALGYHVFVAPILSAVRAPYWSGAIQFSTLNRNRRGSRVTGKPSNLT